MNPFYENPSKAEGYSPLTKAMDKDKGNNAEIKRLCPNKCVNSKIGIKFDPQILSKSEP